MTNAPVIQKCTHGSCNGRMLRDADDWGYGSVLKCISCSRSAEADRPVPLKYSYHEPHLPRPVAAANLTGTCADCQTAIGALATRCQLCRDRAYEARRRVRRAAVVRP